MSGKKGMKRCPLQIRETVVSRIRSGESQSALGREYGISRYTIQTYIHFYNHERIQLNTGVAQLSLRHSA